MKKLTALFLSATMLLSLSVTAFAGKDTHGELEGDGKVEYVYSEDVFDVVLPTVDDDTTTFDFTLDPQGVLYDAHATLADTKNFYVLEDKTLYFKNDVKDPDKSDYYVAYRFYDYVMTGKSDKLDVINMSSFAVNVTVAAEVTGLNVDKDRDGFYDVSLYYESDFVGTAPQVYLALTDGADNTDAILADGGEITSTIQARPDSYELVFDTDNQRYYYQLAEGLDEDSFEHYTFSFQLTGACNPAADWTNLDDITPQVKVTWDVVKRPADRAPAADQNITVTVSGTAATKIDMSGKIDWGFGDLAATKISSITYADSNKYVTKSGDKELSISTTNMSKITSSGYKITLVLDDGTNVKVTVKKG